ALNTLTSSHDYFQLYAISHSQWTALEKIVEFLEPFKDLTIKMSSRSNNTDFEDKEEYIDELDHYILEKTADKEIEVLAW
ncbi:21657_t:CDS:2, partial [Gigaspora margarita]